MLSFKGNKKSFALILALWILIGFSVTAMTAMYVVSRKLDEYINHMNSLKGQYLAESAKNYFLEYALAFDNDLADNTQITKTLGGANLEFSIAYDVPTARTASMTITGDSPGISRSINFDIFEDEDQNSEIIKTLKKYNAFFKNDASITLEDVCTTRGCLEDHDAASCPTNVACGVGANRSTPGDCCELCWNVNNTNPDCNSARCATCYTSGTGCASDGCRPASPNFCCEICFSESTCTDNCNTTGTNYCCEGCYGKDAGPGITVCTDDCPFPSVCCGECYSAATCTDTCDTTNYCCEGCYGPGGAPCDPTDPNCCASYTIPCACYVAECYSDCCGTETVCGVPDIPVQMCWANPVDCGLGWTKSSCSREEEQCMSNEQDGGFMLATARFQLADIPCPLVCVQWNWVCSGFDFWCEIDDPPVCNDYKCENYECSDYQCQDYQCEIYSCNRFRCRTYGCKTEDCTSWRSPTFHATTYFDFTSPSTHTLSVNTNYAGVVAYPSPFTFISPSANNSLWGQSGDEKDVYVNTTNLLDLDLINTTDFPDFGVWGNVYVPIGTTVNAPAGVIRGTEDCGSNPSECGFTVTKPPIDTTYYDRLLIKAQSMPAGDLPEITTASSYRQLRSRNLFVNGDVTISTSSASPLEGPGIIIATGTITVSNNAHVEENISLISKTKVHIGQSARVGRAKTGDTTGFIQGRGVLIYVARDSGAIAVDLDYSSRTKAYILVAPHTSGTILNSVWVRDYHNDASPNDNLFAQFQGIVYTESLEDQTGEIYGHVYTDDLSNEHIEMFRLLEDEVSGVSVESLRPVRIRGLYEVGKSDLIYR